MDPEDQRQIIRQGHARNRLKGAAPPGKAPYGYKRGKQHYTLDRTTAPIVKDFFEHFLLYGSVRGSVRYLAKKYNKVISASTGQRWLTHPVYRGDTEYHTGDVIPDTHVAILSRDEAAQVDRLLRRNRRLPPRTASAQRSLSGLVVCQTCEQPCTVSRTTARGSQTEYLYLRVPNCPERPKCQAIAYHDVLEATITRICADLPPAVAGVRGPDVEAIQQGLRGAIAAKQGILDQLPGLVVQGILDEESATVRVYNLKAEMAEIQAKLSQLPPANLRAIAQTVSIPQFWWDLSESERRFYFREFLRQIQLVRQGDAWSLRLIFIF